MSLFKCRPHVLLRINSRGESCYESKEGFSCQKNQPEANKDRQSSPRSSGWCCKETCLHSLEYIYIKATICWGVAKKIRLTFYNGKRVIKDAELPEEVPELAKSLSSDIGVLEQYSTVLDCMLGRNNRGRNKSSDGSFWSDNDFRSSSLSRRFSRESYVPSF